jgi:hypothetical protein
MWKIYIDRRENLDSHEHMKLQRGFEAGGKLFLNFQNARARSMEANPLSTQMSLSITVAP